MNQNSSGTPDSYGTDSEEEVNHKNLLYQSEESSTLLLTEDMMRKKLQFFFMNPIEKWKAKRRTPYKLIVQIIKIVLVSMQLYLFGNYRYQQFNYTTDNTVTFSHLFLRGWDATREIKAYPASAGPLAIYKVEEFFSTIDYAYEGYSNLNGSIGPYSYPNEDNTMPDMKLCLYQYKSGTIFGFNESYIFDSQIEKRCFNISANNKLLNSREYFKHLNINFSALVTAILTFSIKTVNFKVAGPKTPPDCYRFDIDIKFDNNDHDGQMLLSLESKPIRLTCHGDVHYMVNNEIDLLLRSLLNILVIIICCISCILCSRAIWRAQQLATITNNFFKLNYRRDLSFSGKMEFVNFWYILIVINDVLIVIGSSLKEGIERKRFTDNNLWDIASILVGTGTMFVWFALLRYLGFFKTYNVIMLTVTKAFPRVVRFLLCAMLIYAGFMLCGWLVFGPYHVKFRSISVTSECLFSLINGDDMFATFSIMSEKSLMIWWFSKFYLYIFICLYIYVVLSLFISIIMDAYETIKIYYKEGFPKTDLQAFIGDSASEDVTTMYRFDSNGSLNGLLQDLTCCCRKIHKSYSTLNNSCSAFKSNSSTSGIPI